MRRQKGDEMAQTRSLRADCEQGRDGRSAGDELELSAHAVPSWPLRSHLELGALPSAVPCARLHAKHVSWEWGLDALLSQVATRGRQVIDGLYTAPAGTERSTAPHHTPATSPPGQGAHQIRWPHQSAVVQVINVPHVLRAAERAGAIVAFAVGSGEMIAEGAALALVTGPAEPGLEREVLKAITVGDERTFEQDPALALRLLADIALRALSPAVNDPTTAVQALDRIESLLRVLATRDLSMENVADSSGTTRVKLVLPTWDQYLAVALDEIIALPGLLPSVSHRLTRLLDDLAAIAPPSRRPELEKRRAQIAPPA
jgi:uncharacterized membrane protein